MIDPKSLRIGNWVMYRKTESTEAPFKPLEIYEESFCDIEGWHIIVEGIPLSATVLEKAGFEYIKTFDYFSKTYQSNVLYSKRGRVIFINYIKSTDTWDVNIGSNNQVVVPVSIKYLHQLQNIYYLLSGGKELDIKFQ